MFMFDKSYNVYDRSIICLVLSSHYFSCCSCCSSPPPPLVRPPPSSTTVLNQLAPCHHPVSELPPKKKLHKYSLLPHLPFEIHKHLLHISDGRLVGQSVRNTFRFPLRWCLWTIYRTFVDHGTWYIFQKLWPTAFRLYPVYASSKLCEFILPELLFPILPHFLKPSFIFVLLFSGPCRWVQNPDVCHQLNTNWWIIKPMLTMWQCKWHHLVTKFATIVAWACCFSGNIYLFIRCSFASSPSCTMSTLLHYIQSSDARHGKTGKMFNSNIVVSVEPSSIRWQRWKLCGMKSCWLHFSSAKNSWKTRSDERLGIILIRFYCQRNPFKILASKEDYVEDHTLHFYDLLCRVFFILES